ncbi:MAG: tRNA (N(6)-L-threonylcarbamoyladenosine(37)-C(2))-methylthiotransferase MtaB [Desulfobacteraceae bacterium 4572_35.1]|nr:MAG: tRNA (N(6)-L-threonylcarbamoyladenosine(37)-C(2))-methylthiotransferase MtaB [Desulfobacteraceae bacterium 4572_35.1]
MDISLQSRKLIRKAYRLNPACHIIVTGCYAQINPRQLADLPEVSLVFGNMEKQNIVSMLPELTPANTPGKSIAPLDKIHVADISKVKSCPDLHISSFAEHSRAFVQIQTGCDSFCSYCIIPYARGRSRSVPLNKVIEQIKDLVAHGYHEVVLTGIHIGNYGRDLNPKLTLAQLTEEILGRTKLHRLRLGSIEPLELSDELISLVTENKRICSHFHIPLQSGSDSVLKRMNRHYTADQFRRSVETIFSQDSKCAIGIDLISGFPGETEQDHMASIKLVEQLPVGYLHVFPYSKRPGTSAAIMVDQINPALAKTRAAQLREIGAKKQQQYIRRFVGTELEVVVEKARSDNSWRGISAEYIPVSFPCNDNISGKCLMVAITAVHKNGVELQAAHCN